MGESAIAPAVGAHAPGAGSRCRFSPAPWSRSRPACSPIIAALEGLLPALLLRSDPPEGRVRDGRCRCSRASSSSRRPGSSASCRGRSRPGSTRCTAGRAGWRSRSRLPVAYHCIFKLGFQHPDARVLAHSLLGCAVYGAFAAKVTILRLHRFPMPVLPVAGGLLFATLIGVWYTSALWLYGRSTPKGTPSRCRRRRMPRPGASSHVRTAAPATPSAAAQASGTVGPNLEPALRPGFDQVRAPGRTRRRSDAVVPEDAHRGADPRRRRVRRGAGRPLTGVRGSRR